jgi:hypothetical protein
MEAQEQHGAPKMQQAHFLALDPQAGVDEPGGGEGQGEEQEVGGLKSILSKFDEIAQNFAKKFGI